MRDKRGWHIPGPGTRQREVYDLLVAGLAHKEIGDLTGLGMGVGAYIRRIRKVDDCRRDEERCRREKRRKRS